MSPKGLVDPSKLETRLFINNEFVNAESGKTFPSLNPATEEVITHVQEADKADIDKAVAAAVAAFDLGSEWRGMDGTARRDLMLKFVELVERDRAFLEELECMDNGKPVGRLGMYGSSVDLELLIRVYKYFAGWADKITGKVIPVDGNMLCYTRKEPIGACGLIVPWNYPLLMIAWSLAPALAAGCTVVIKTSEKTPLAALHMAKLFREAGFPPGVINVVSGYGPTAGQALARHPDIGKIGFTGSTATGHKIMQYAAESNLKKVTLELGGKSPMIVFDDADIETAISAAHVGLFLNQGQCCCAGSRLFVQEGIYDKFVAAAIEKAKSIKIGAYTEDTSDTVPIEQGPQVDSLQFEKVLGYIEKGKEEGATVACGGGRHGDKGYFVQPTVFTDVKDDMTIAKEEIFGPVMSILKFKTDEEVIERANKTAYGLGAGICSANGARAVSAAHQIRAGTVWINTFDNFDAAAPFGGFKKSGIGRTKGEDSLDCWLETKCVMMPLQGPKC
uniref:aldehyde dehydrogenase (NAD(+)) n=1 Tax=Trieres chinensis TaxID=1514140 RepID=A0A7S1Z7U6_TRICV|eukprot:CAMPEP_0183291812 /NCGR_PEP_ID=MMETSP0160_2-20130417/1097_1 /TAXON_ID=2839 ORGANISM="Odontella Sinensis, Strain Grunow 1884" /NCGR_SAMPLE_ID=MMETSP0160_2 /ASSEMBLY_ACC=CAM_ASM_000250 /LENGTH=503 /DNA_ID=CAMNT_0025452667 /DNA_START=117 /DNA_END=1628 /DNA_ORIENTATION=-